MGVFECFQICRKVFVSIKTFFPFRPGKYVYSDSTNKRSKIAVSFPSLSKFNAINEMRRQKEGVVYCVRMQHCDRTEFALRLHEHEWNSQKQKNRDTYLAELWRHFQLFTLTYSMFLFFKLVLNLFPILSHLYYKLSGHLNISLSSCT